MSDVSRQVIEFCASRLGRLLCGDPEAADSKELADLSEGEELMVKRCREMYGVVSDRVRNLASTSIFLTKVGRESGERCELCSKRCATVIKYRFYHLEGSGMDEFAKGCAVLSRIPWSSVVRPWNTTSSSTEVSLGPECSKALVQAHLGLYFGLGITFKISNLVRQLFPSKFRSYLGVGGIMWEELSSEDVETLLRSKAWTRMLESIDESLSGCCDSESTAPRWVPQFPLSVIAPPPRVKVFEVPEPKRKRRSRVIESDSESDSE